MKWAGRLVLLLVLLGVLAASYLYFRIQSARVRQQSPLGEFELVEVTTPAQPFVDGTAFERALDKVMPSRSIHFGNFLLRGPARHKVWGKAPLTAWILYRGAPLERGKTPPLFGSRAVVRSASGKEFENPISSVRRSSPDELLISLPIETFPDEPDFVLRFSPPARREPDRTWVEFKIRNALYGHRQLWSLNQTNFIHGHPIVLRELRLTPARCSFELPSRDWSPESCTAVAKSGARLVPTGAHSTLTSYECKFADVFTDDDVWRIDLTLMNAVDLPSVEQSSLRLTAHAPAQTITNGMGVCFECKFDGEMVSVVRLSAVPSRFWSILQATDANSGEPLKLSKLIPQDGSNAAEYWTLPSPKQTIALSMAYPKPLKTHFLFNPSRATIPPEWIEK